MPNSKISAEPSDLIQRFLAILRDQRTTLLVDYLCDMRCEMRRVIGELTELDFDVADFLSALDDDDGADCDFAHDRERAAVH